MGWLSPKRPTHDAEVVWDPDAHGPRIICSCGWEFHYPGPKPDYSGQTDNMRIWGDGLYMRLEEHQRTGE